MGIYLIVYLRLVFKCKFNWFILYKISIIGIIFEFVIIKLFEI